ncbi:MAG: hypothetical protein HY078_09665 [Elusimicrobia bacterium]|nr:hypothetical protein [Elusimicrobiota bacterium]
MLAAALAAAVPGWGEGTRYVAEDSGAFASTGRFVEMADRYGWKSYEISFAFELDRNAGAIAGAATLDVTIRKLDGGSWSYRCKQSRGELRGRVYQMYGRGTSVLAECAIPPKAFAGAVGVDWDMVGKPTLVFQALVKGAAVEPGNQKGFYVLPGNHVEGHEMNQYVTPTADPTNLSVLFASERGLRGLVGPTAAPRFIP